MPFLADQSSLIAPPNWPLLFDENGHIFVDRDGELFYYILDFLRNGNLCLPPNYSDRQRLNFEAKFLKLDQLSACIAAIAAKSSSLMAVDPKDYMLTSASGGGGGGGIADD
uniref:Potassium channel tetramerisation-type BTB domain-containing protein n=1 Tax=Romanomermis culicivorax TaxID=13658 RepID=A0A915K7R3_ROMCU